MGEEIMSVVCASFTAHGHHVNMKIHWGSHRGDGEEQMQKNLFKMEIKVRSFQSRARI